MRKVKFILLLAFAFCTGKGLSDIVVTFYSPNKICVKIVNLSDYPDIVVVGISDCLPVFSKPKMDVLVSDSSLEVHKACPLNFYAVKKNYLKKKGINKIKWNNDKNVRKADHSVSAKTHKAIFPDVETLEVSYFIVGFDENSMVLIEKSRENLFANGERKSIGFGGVWHNDESIMNQSKYLQLTKNLKQSF